MDSVISLISSRKIVPPFGHFEQAALVLVGAGERALHVAEQFAFEQRFRKCAAIDRNKRLGGAR